MLVNQYVGYFKNIGFTAQFSFAAFIIAVSLVRAHSFEKLRRQAGELNARLNSILLEKTKQLEETQKRLATVHNGSQGVIEELYLCMEHRKPHLDPQLTLDGLAKLISVNRNQLSYAMNQVLGKSFNDFVNEYRVQEFLSLAKNRPSEEKILTLAFDVGFSSKPTFNSVFKQVMGITPSEYRKKILETVVQ